MEYLMNKLSYIASGLLLASALSSQDIQIQDGWQLLGATQDLNISTFDSTCVDYIWKYDNTVATAPEWQLHISNTNAYSSTDNYGHDSLVSLIAGDGYWVKGNSDGCNIIVNETLTDTGLTISYDTYSTLYKPMMPNLSVDNKYFHGNISYDPSPDADIIYNEFGSMIAQSMLSNKLYIVGGGAFAGNLSMEITEITYTDTNRSKKWTYYSDGVEQSSSTEDSTVAIAENVVTEDSAYGTRTLKFSKLISTDALHQMYLDIGLDITFDSNDKAQFRFKHQETGYFNAIDLVLNESAYLKVNEALEPEKEIIGTGTIVHNGYAYNPVSSTNTYSQEIIANGNTYPMGTQRIWLDRNLGASQICTAHNDEACYGDYYQWGRDTDGHEKVGSTITEIQTTTIDNAGSEFVIKPWDWPTVDAYDWTTADVNGTERALKWSKTDGSSVCPVGYRVPTKDEWKAETTQAETPVTEREDAFASFLKLSSANSRAGSALNATGDGEYWTSTYVNTTYKIANYFYFYANYADFGSKQLYVAYPVRCIKD